MKYKICTHFPNNSVALFNKLICYVYMCTCMSMFKATRGILELKISKKEKRKYSSKNILYSFFTSLKQC